MSLDQMRNTFFPPLFPYFCTSQFCRAFFLFSVYYHSWIDAYCMHTIFSTNYYYVKIVINMLNIARVFAEGLKIKCCLMMLSVSFAVCVFRPLSQWYSSWFWLRVCCLSVQIICLFLGDAETVVGSWGANLFLWSCDQPFLVSLNRDVLKSCSVNCDGGTLRERWTAKIIHCEHIHWRSIEDIQ